jgi:NAD(P)-dependent dehydrogenase (short-subunit alcohol dehydrogenase family)
MNRLKDKVAVVTGSGSGMGEGIVRLFAEEGARVVVSGRDEAKGEAVASEIAAQGAQAVFIRADVSVETDCRALMDKTVEHYGMIDVLVNNVGLTTRGTIEDTTVELWDKLFATNVRSAFICMQQAVKYMKERGLKKAQGGSIINIGSVNAYIGEPKLMAYSATKGAMMTLTKNTASYLNRYRIRVNQLNVGWTLTPNEHYVKTVEEGRGEDWLEEAVKTRPWGRLLLPRDIAMAALYFAGDESELITGSVLDLEQYPVGRQPNW